MLIGDGEKILKNDSGKKEKAPKVPKAFFHSFYYARN